MDPKKKYESYKGLQTSFQQHFANSYNPSKDAIHQYLQNKGGKNNTFKLAYREYENPFNSIKNQGSSKPSVVKIKGQKVSPLKA